MDCVLWACTTGPVLTLVQSNDAGQHPSGEWNSIGELEHDEPGYRLVYDVSSRTTHTCAVTHAYPGKYWTVIMTTVQDVYRDSEAAWTALI